MKIWTGTLSYPPSVNRLWRYTARGVYRTKVYTDWLAVAGQEITSRPLIKEPCKLVLRASPPDRRKRDIDNIIKPIGDLLEHNLVVENDHLIHQLDVAWDHSLPKATVDLVLTTIGAKDGRQKHGRDERTTGKRDRKTDGKTEGNGGGSREG